MKLQVSDEIKDLFKYITRLDCFIILDIIRFKPVKVEISSKLKPFIPDFIPAIGEVDAFLKMDRPDNKEEILGTVMLVIITNLGLILG